MLWGWVWRSILIHVRRVFVNFCIDLMAGRRLHVGGDEEVVRLLHHVCVVLQIVALHVLARAALVLAALDNGGNDNNEDDDNDYNEDDDNDNNEEDDKVVG